MPKFNDFDLDLQKVETTAFGFGNTYQTISDEYGACRVTESCQDSCQARCTLYAC